MGVLQGRNHREATQGVARFLPPSMPAMVMALLTAAGLLAADYAPPSTGQMAVVFPILTDEMTAWQIVVASGGSIVAPSRFSNIVVAYAPDPEFASRVRSGGALFTLAARGLCEPLTSQAQPVSR
ncbi:hypothetical protein AB3G45_03450 [Shinella sp. S4-D37]|uniref:hypothetical protein n=1 Tax=Shinella sp. S4-D37 TaxID=3161999 RepID=UPI00346700E9